MIIPLVIAIAVALVVYFLCFYDNGHGGFAYSPPAMRPNEDRREGTLETVFFPATDGTRLEGWLFRPRLAPAPLVLMAPGLTGTKEGHLEAFAWTFVQSGIAVLLFDYRGFGGSEGEPRHWVDLGRHRDDYEAALRFACDDLSRTGAVDAARIALWGSSFSGGTALVFAASRPDEIRAVVAQAPFLATPPALEPSRDAMARYMVWTTLDLARAQLNRWLRLSLAPVYMPVFGRPGEIAFACSRENPSVRNPDQGGSDFWRQLPRPQRGGWENKMLARMLADFDRLTPMEHVAGVRCPVYLVCAEHDDLVPAAMIAAAHGRLQHPASRLDSVACAHFDLYLAPVREENARRQAEFLVRLL